MNSDPSVHHLSTALPLKAKCAMRNQAHRYDCLIAYPNILCLVSVIFLLRTQKWWRLLSNVDKVKLISVGNRTTASATTNNV